MLKKSEITAVNNFNVLDEDTRLNLAQLVFRSEYYKRTQAFWPDVPAKLLTAITAAKAAGASDAEKAVGKALAAIVTRVEGLPGFRAESQGSDQQRSFVSIPENWDELAQDVLNTLTVGGYYSVVPAEARLAMGIIQRTLADLCAMDNRGRQYWDEKSGFLR